MRRSRRCRAFPPRVASAFEERHERSETGTLAGRGGRRSSGLWRRRPSPRRPARANRRTAWSTRCARRWSRPMTPTRRSWPSASRCAPPTRTPRSPAPPAGRAFRSRRASTRTSSTRNLGANGRDLNAGATISVPVFSGGRVRNGVRAADTRVEAGRADLRATEGDIFTEAVAAYMDVIRDRSIVQLNENQVRVLDTNLQATRDRFEVGDLTRTDVAQSEARLALARSNLALAEGRLRASEENYERVIGVAPGNLQPPPPLPTAAADHATGDRRGARQQCRSCRDRCRGRAPPASTSRSRAAPGCRPSRRPAPRATPACSAPPTPTRPACRSRRTPPPPAASACR